jgi:single-strand DNA-binding protein
MSWHTLVLIGNLGRDPEMRYTPSGTPVTSFNVASNRSYTDQSGQKVDETIWFRVTAWGKQAETCNQYLHKGSKVLVEGRLVPDSNGGPRIWQKQDGTPGASFEVNASTVRFLSNGAGSHEGGDGGYESGSFVADDDIPF